MHFLFIMLIKLLKYAACVGYAWAYIDQGELEQFKTFVVFYIFYATVQYAQSLASNLLHNIYYWFTAPMWFDHRI